MKKIAILQSNYIPWKGYFDIINSVDDFVIYDVVQYTKNDWRNRNKIKTQKGSMWLTIPVQHTSLSQKICETQISDTIWAIKHWKTLHQYYNKARFYKEIEELLKPLYQSVSERNLSKINFSFLKRICEYLGVSTKFHWANDFDLKLGQNERLIGICKDLGAKTYISGPAAKGYLDTALFIQEGIEVEWMDYSGYPEYSQLYPPFDHGVSILDLLFNEGPDSNKFMKSFKK